MTKKQYKLQADQYQEPFTENQDQQDFGRANQMTNKQYEVPMHQYQEPITEHHGQDPVQVHQTTEQVNTPMKSNILGKLI